MLFKFKKKKITLDCFTANAGAMLTPPSKGANFFPSWWKNLPAQVVRNQIPGSDIKVPAPTIKRCPGFMSYYTSAIVLPMWSDLVIRTDADGSYQWQYSMGSVKDPISSHPAGQHNNMMPGWYNLKITTPWLLKEKTGVKWMLGDAFWNNPAQNDYVIPNGVLDFKYQCTLNINTMVRDEEREWLIEHNTPMLHMIPLVEDNVEIEVKTHLLSSEEYDQMANEFHMHKFIGSYHDRKRKGWG